MKIKAVNYLGGKCVDCGLKTDRVEVYDFHHLDPTIKDDGIGELLRASWETIVAELDKCIVLCCNCHRIRERDIDEASMKARCLSIGRTLPEHLAA